MIPARLIKALEARGFALEFPAYVSDEELIIDIIRQENPRLDQALPLLLRREFDYKEIISKMGPSQGKRFNRILLISDWIFKQEGLERDHLRKIIREHRLKAEITDSERSSCHDVFRESLRRSEREEEQHLEEDLAFRDTLRTNQALAEIFSKGKRRIMAKIYGHEQLTNSELKYYYRAIRPLCRAILNRNMQAYARIIETTRKLIEKKEA